MNNYQFTAKDIHEIIKSKSIFQINIGLKEEMVLDILDAPPHKQKNKYFILYKYNNVTFTIIEGVVSHFEIAQCSISNITFDDLDFSNFKILKSTSSINEHHGNDVKIILLESDVKLLFIDGLLEDVFIGD